MDIKPYENDQQVVELVAYHLGFQNEKSIGFNDYKIEVCLYRGPDRLKCAIGALIPDEIYNRNFNSKTFSRVLYENIKINKLFINISEELLTSLQIIHDTYPIENWKSELEKISVKCELNTTKILSEYDRGCNNRLNKT